ncbi:hypothetical protein ZIOFF_013669 [Zingiber officinale]|uniref:Reverse transcriptase Ty1/copia-type domain-containing protein n=1 Tax=Zingiber officinale TaxID=94328 RepID=A0A8J5HGC3_ZINOF|nr:hypothetical protein ZIOFF_013669 [Zingiber officinale]
MFGEFKEVMTKEFEMTDIGLMAYYLGIEVNQREDGSFISQAGYAREILKKFRMDNSKSINTLVECGVKLSKHDEEEKVDPTFFKSLVGSLRYLMCTRPDILYAVGLVSRYMEDPTTTHLKIAKRILRYIKGTIDFGLFYSTSNHFKLEGYSDSDWGGDIDDRKSTTGFVFFMGDTAFTWMSKKQPIVTLSTCEAEYVAATSCVCHAVWLRNLLNELSLPQEEATKIRNPVQATQENSERRKTSKYFAPSSKEVNPQTIIKEEKVAAKTPSKRKPQKSSEDITEDSKPTLPKRSKTVDDDNDDFMPSSNVKKSPKLDKKMKNSSVTKMTKNSHKVGENLDDEINDTDPETRIKAGGRGKGGRGSGSMAAGRGRGAGRGGFMNFGERNDPPHKREKEVPEGAPGCLAGQTFVISATLDSDFPYMQLGGIISLSIGRIWRLQRFYSDGILSRMKLSLWQGFAPKPLAPSYSIKNCTELRALYLRANYLQGNIPPEIGELVHLTIL